MYAVFIIIIYLNKETKVSKKRKLFILFTLSNCPSQTLNINYIELFDEKKKKNNKWKKLLPTMPTRRIHINNKRFSKKKQ